MRTYRVINNSRTFSPYGVMIPRGDQTAARREEEAWFAAECMSGAAS
jgi:hypothetical protein